jgi:hypothetical protein
MVKDSAGRDIHRLQITQITQIKTESVKFSVWKALGFILFSTDLHSYLCNLRNLWI